MPPTDSQLLWVILLDDQGEVSQDEVSQGVPVDVYVAVDEGLTSLKSIFKDITGLIFPVVENIGLTIVHILF